MRVVVLGAGSLGSLVSGLLATTDANVTLLGHENEHLDAIRKNGLRLVHPNDAESLVDVQVTADPDVIDGPDIIVVCVKCYDTREAMADIADQTGGADILTLQNGLGNAETIAESVPREQVIVGTTTHGAVMESPGVVRHAGHGDTEIGRFFASNDECVREAANTLTEAGIATSVTDEPESAVWSKVLVNVGINAVTALSQVSNGALVSSNAGERLLERAVQEGIDVACAERITVDEDPIQRTRDVAERTATNHSSMRQDLDTGTRTEIEALNGALVRRAAEHDISVPVNETITDLIRLAEWGFTTESE